MKTQSQGLSQILEKDQAYVWHPYSSVTQPIPAYEVDSAQGVYLNLANGKKLIDGMSSWWCAIHGYNHATLNRAITDQLEKMSHVMFGGITHAPAVELCEKLVYLTPDGLNKVFLSDSGSVSVEVAIKMAFQYWISQGKSDKNQLLTLSGGYHGDTFAAMSVCDPVNGMHHMFDKVMAKHLFAPRPEIEFHQNWCDSDIAEFETIISTKHQQLAAVILEPIVQGAGGMRFYSPSYLKRVRELCDQYNVLLITDEIATGFGRTGKMFGRASRSQEYDERLRSRQKWSHLRGFLRGLGHRQAERCREVEAYQHKLPLDPGAAGVQGVGVTQGSRD